MAQKPPTQKKTVVARSMAPRLVRATTKASLRQLLYRFMCEAKETTEP